MLEARLGLRVLRIVASELSVENIESRNAAHSASLREAKKAPVASKALATGIFHTLSFSIE